MEQQADPQFGAPPSGLQPQGWAPPVPPSSPVGTLSPDGQYRWDGTHWVPTGVSRSPWRGDMPGMVRSQGHGAYQDASTRAWLTLAGLLGAALCLVLLIVAELGRLDIVNRVLDGQGLSETEAVHSDDFVRLSGSLEVLLTLFTGVVFFMWLHRVVANNHALGRWPLRFSPGWAVGWWFVPFAALVRVPQVMRETWRATTRDQRAGAGAVALIVAWWVIGLVSAGLWNEGTTLRSSGDALQGLHDATVVDLWAAALMLATILLGALMVWRIWTGQRQIATEAGAPA